MTLDEYIEHLKEANALVARLLSARKTSIVLRTDEQWTEIKAAKARLTEFGVSSF